MSHAATLWAIQQRGLKPATKIVLWQLCDRFNPDYGCFPSQERLAHDCEISRATLNRHLDILEAGGLIQRIRAIDPQTRQQRPTRYLLQFEPGFTPRGPGDDGGATDDFDLSFASEFPCSELRHGSAEGNESQSNMLGSTNSEYPCLNSGHGAVSHSCAKPCLKNGGSRVSNPDTNLVREPIRKPVKEEEDARARDGNDEEVFGSLLLALGFDPGGSLPGWWQGWPPREHVRRWQTDLGLTAAEILNAAGASRLEHPEPPDGPKALDRIMQRVAQRKVVEASRKRRKPKASSPGPTHRPITDVPAFYADLVNSDHYLPVSAITNSTRDAMLARGLVTAERLRERGIQ